jgi:alanine dehydrogenase
MDIAIPRETRTHEYRVALTPTGVLALVQEGHRLFVETGAGIEAGYSDHEFQAAGATTVYSREEVLGRGDVVACIYVPTPDEYRLLRPGQVVLGFWALASARPEDFRKLLDCGVTAIGIEIIEDGMGRAPVLTSMSEIAGKLAVTIGSGLLLNEFGGKGLLLPGAPGVPPANFVIIGAGVLGRSAAQAARGLGAHVVLLDRSVEHLRYACGHLGAAVPTMLATKPNIEKALSFADILLAAVAVRGEKPPLLITREMLRIMKPRSVLMDLSIDMGGCTETSRPTSFPNPVYEVDGILHFCVPNLPSVAARSATAALTNALLPYLMRIADSGVDKALLEEQDLARGTYVYRGNCCKKSLAGMFAVEHRPLAEKDE